MPPTRCARLPWTKAVRTRCPSLRPAADAADVRDDLIDRTAEGDPSLRSSVTEGVVGQGVPQADPDTPDPQRETGIDTDKPAR